MPVAENLPILTTEGNFEVKESVARNTVIAVVLCPICFYEMYKALALKHDYLTIMYFVFLLGCVICMVIKIFNRKIIILVNPRGIYIHNELVTNWANFVEAKYTQQDITGSYKDNFVLLLYYYKADGEYYGRKVALTNTQDKAEEEVIETIRYFSQLSLQEESVSE